MDQVNDEALIAEAEKQLSRIEELHPELLKSAACYMLYLPSDRAAAIRVCVLGSDGHAVAHLVDYMYPNATVIWITNVKCYEKEYEDSVDYLIYSEKISQCVSECLFSMKLWKPVLKNEGLLIRRISEPFENRLLYDEYAMNGFRMESIDSNGICLAQMISTPRMSIEEKQSYGIIYVLCPAATKSGGPELCHQLVYWINRMSGNAKIAYIQNDPNAALCLPEYLDYVAGSITTIEDVEDDLQNVVVVPEGWPTLLERFQKATCMFWWMSVDNYIHSIGDPDDAKIVLQWIDMKATRHLVQSMYAKDYLLHNGISDEKIDHLGDYVNQIYLDNCCEIQWDQKEELVLYNPNKGKEYVNNLMRLAPEIPWRPISGLTTQEVCELMHRAKVYIDFGNHPGKDRIPREAAMSGCIVITGTRGAAAFFEDVAIPEEYKLSEELHSYEDVLRMIRICLKNYKQRVRDFDDYRRKISMEREEFVEDIERLFF